MRRPQPTPDAPRALGPVLLTGMGGVLGAGLARGGLATAWQRQGGAAPELIVVGRERPRALAALRFERCDFEQPGAAAALVARLRPRAVLHAAALSRLDACEQEPARAQALNVDAVRELAAAMAAHGGARLVYCSTDQVFDGSQERLFEDASPNPIHAYGRSKAAGEIATLEARLPAGTAVVRLPLLLGPAVPGRPERCGADATLVRAARAGQPWQLFTDEWRAPADPADFVAALVRLLDEDQNGTFHLAGRDAVDRYTLGEWACAAAGVASPHQPATLADWTGAPRPARLILDCQRAARELGFDPPDLRQSLARSARAAASDPEMD